MSTPRWRWSRPENSGDGLSAADRTGVQKAATEAGLLQRKLLDDADKDVIGKFHRAPVCRSARSPPPS